MTSRISRVVVTPVAFADPPLLNVVGVHQPWALRAIVEVYTDSGLLGLGETYADEAHLARLAAVASALPGLDPFDLAGVRRVVVDVLGRETGGAGRPSAACSTCRPPSRRSTPPSRSPASTSRATRPGGR